MNGLRRQSAFTVIELLVAISVTVLLMTMVFQLFQNTQRAVTTGIQSGEMMVESETIGNQIRRDADAMRPPSDDNADRPGFLVIVQRQIDDAQLRTTTGEVVTDIRSDQLIFIRGTAPDRKIHALTPESGDTLASNIGADHARVWYGHSLRALPDGTPMVDPGSDAILGLGAPGDGAIPPNLYANSWVLGRQALLLAGDPSGTNFDPNEDIHAANAEWDAAVANWAAPERIHKVFDDLDLYPDYQSEDDRPLLLQGLTDVANQALHNTTPGEESVLDEIEGEEADGASYPEAALPYAVPPFRPHVNSDPDTGYFAPWRVAQMHTYLSGKVSDIIIDFAGDYDSDPGIDREDGDIKWYSQWYNNQDEGKYNPEDPGDSDAFDDSLPVTWDVGALDLGTGVSPENEAYYLSREDIENDHPDYQDIADAVFVFRHDDADSDETKWPYLIRIRYRMHDPRGYVGSGTEDGERIHGRWFEHVIQVRRPD